jgi:hypothetical protein
MRQQRRLRDHHGGHRHAEPRRQPQLRARGAALAQQAAVDPPPRKRAAFHIQNQTVNSDKVQVSIRTFILS